MRIFVCSPFAGGKKSVKKNIVLARYLCRAIAMHGHAPVAPHLFCPQFLDDKIPTERKVGLSIALQLLEACDELHYCIQHGMSESMRAEIDHATHVLQIPIKEMKIELP